jgi:hypothetical protein
VAGNSKGSILLYTKDYVVQQLGEHTWTNVLEQLSEEDRAFFRGMPLASSWYSVAHWNRLMGVVLPLIGTDPDDGMRKLATHIAQADLNSVYKLVMKLGSPEFLLRRTGQLWSRYFDAGALTPEELGDRHWKLQLSGPTSMEAAPDAFTCGPGVTAWVTSGLLLSGTQARVVETRCRFKGALRCEYDVTW